MNKKNAYKFHPVDTNICVENIGNRFDLILVASQRIRELRKGSKQLVKMEDNHPVIALTEIEQGLIGKEYLTKIK